MADFGISLAVGLASRALLSILSPKPKQDESKLPTLDTPKSNYGSAIPAFIGTNRVTGNMVWANPIRRRKKKQRVGKGLGGRKEVTYSHDASFFVLLGERLDPEQGSFILNKVWLNSTLFYDRGSGNSDLNDYALDYMTFYDGSESQSQVSDMVSRDGVDKTPAYRNYLGLFFKDLPLDNEKQSYNASFPTVEVELYAPTGKRFDEVVFDYCRDRAGVFVNLGGGNLTERVDNNNNPVKGFVFTQDGKAPRDYLEAILGLSQTFIVTVTYQDSEESLRFTTQLNQLQDTRTQLDINSSYLGFGERDNPPELVKVEAYDPEDLASVLTLSYRTLDDQKNGEVSFELPSRQTWGDQGVLRTFSGNTESVSTDATIDHTYAKNTAAYLLNQKSNRKNIYELVTSLDAIDGVTVGSILTYTHQSITYNLEVVEITLDANLVATLKVSPRVETGSLQVGAPESLPPLVPAPNTTITVVALNTRRISSTDSEFSPKFLYQAPSPILFGSLYGSNTNNLPDYQLINEIDGNSEIGVLTSHSLSLTASPHVPDYQSTLTISMFWGQLETLTDTQWRAETNILYCRGELIGFKDVVAVSPGVYQVSGLIRGMYGTQSKIGLSVSNNEPIYILKGLDSYYSTLSGNVNYIGQLGYFKANESGSLLENAPTTSFTYTGEDVKPARPQLLTFRQPNGDVLIEIIPASRFYYNTLTEPTFYPIGDDSLQFKLEFYYGSTLVRTTIVNGDYLYLNSDRTVENSGNYGSVKCTPYNTTYNLYGESIQVNY